MLGEVIRQHREARGWKQQTLGTKSGLTQSYISNIERGARKGITLAALAAIANALEISLTELIEAARTDGFTPAVRSGVSAADDLPAPLANLVNRLGNVLTEDDYRLISAYAEGLAARRAADRQAHTYRAPDFPNSDQVMPNGKDDENTPSQKTA